MFTIPQPIPVAFVKDFISDEVHIVGKAAGNPRAVLSFLAVDAQGKTVPNTPVAVVTLTGDAYNDFYKSWTSETALYKSLLKLLAANKTGMEVAGVDLSKVAGMLTATDAEEVVAEA